MVNLPASFLVVKLMPQECAVQGVGFGIHGGGGSLWQVSGSAFHIIAGQKKHLILTTGNGN